MFRPLEGPWGSGKSNLLALTLLQLGAMDRTKVAAIEFRPWLIGDRDQLLTALFEDLAKPVEGQVDVVIRFGRPPFNEGTVIASRGDTITPVCSPDYLQRRTPGPLSVNDELIDTEAEEQSWLTWSHRMVG
ncbi:P-loop NTPase fold protein (plasmid) [Agrobacterium leguminum]|uniref:P-loop NTPase fold protein n=1 Tax=Agrobacterium leguminum TaxID=2792015 RepID=UPI0030CB9F43